MPSVPVLLLVGFLSRGGMKKPDPSFTAPVVNHVGCVLLLLGKAPPEGKSFGLSGSPSTVFYVLPGRR